MNENNTPAIKTVSGSEKTQFKKGQSGNPSGRPKMDPDIRKAFTELTPIAVAKLQEIILKADTKDADRLKAIDIALDRGLGKPIQGVDLDMKSMPQIVFKGGDDVRD